MILGFASALNYLDYFLIIYRDRSQCWRMRFGKSVVMPT
jgi:hypothetical protein